MISGYLRPQFNTQGYLTLKEILHSRLSNLRPRFYTQEDFTLKEILNTQGYLTPARNLTLKEI